MSSEEHSRPAAVVFENASLEKRSVAADVEQALFDEHVHYSHRAQWLRAFVLGATDGAWTRRVRVLLDKNAYLCLPRQELSNE